MQKEVSYFTVTLIKCMAIFIKVHASFSFFSIAVAASDSNDVFAWFSNYDGKCVEIIAPVQNANAVS